MIVIARKTPDRNTPASNHDAFLAILPAIKRQAHFAFRSQPSEAREELVQEVIANCYAAYVRLVQLGKQGLAYASPLTKYAIRQVRVGRRVGGRLNIRDVSSRYGQQIKGIVMERLDQFDAAEGGWREALVEDRHAGPAETAAARIDVGAWLRSLPPRTRRIAQLLAKGETTSEAAQKVKLSNGRVSQFRRELEESWSQYQGERAAKT